MDDKLTKSEAYRAMFKFIESYFELGGSESDDIGILLGSMQLAKDGHPLDSAIQKDWDEAIKATIRDTRDAN